MGAFIRPKSAAPAAAPVERPLPRSMPARNFGQGMTGNPRFSGMRNGGLATTSKDKKGKKFAEGGSTRKPGIPLPSDRATGYRSQVADTGMTPEERMNSMRKFAGIIAASSGPGLISKLASSPAKRALKPLSEKAKAEWLAKHLPDEAAAKAAAKVAAKADKPEGMKRGGSVKKYARGGGIESKGKTKGRMC